MGTGTVRPMFVLVHGAWQGAWCWTRLQGSLRHLGALSIAVDLPGHGDDRTPITTLTLVDYADRVADVVDALDEPVMLVGHSLGGATISVVAERLPEQISGLVYLCALMQPSGSTPSDLHRHDPHSALIAAIEMAPDGSATTIRPDAAAELFYGDCRPHDVETAVSRLVPEPIGPAMSTIETTAARWGSVPRAYVRCSQDRAITPAEQDRMIAEVGADVVVELASSHSPFLSQPDALAAELVEIRDGLA